MKTLVAVILALGVGFAAAYLLVSKQSVAPDGPRWLSLTLLGLFGLAKWFQKFVPAT